MTIEENLWTIREAVKAASSALKRMTPAEKKALRLSLYKHYGIPVPAKDR
jgi:hypothetical protein